MRTNCFFFNSDEEEFTETSAQSPHNIIFHNKHNISTYETAQLINGSSVIPYVTKSKLPSDVIRTVAFVIDSDSLKNCFDVGIDAWGWEVWYIWLKHHPHAILLTRFFSKVRTYKSVLDQVKRNLQTGNRPTRALFQVEKKFGGLENVPNQYLAPRCSEAF